LQLRAQAILALKKKALAEPETRQARLNWEPLPKQRLLLETPAFATLYGGAAGGGKLLAVDTPIATPAGWRTMGDLDVGDVVFDEQGQPCMVTEAFPTVIPPLAYRLTFDDGATILAGGEHKWLTLDTAELAAMTRRDPAWRAQRRATRPTRAITQAASSLRCNAELRLQRSRRMSAWNQTYPTATLPPPSGTVRTTDEIAHTLRTPSGRANHAIAVSAPLELAPRSLPLDPHLLGLWLGDGNAQGARFSTADPELLEAFTAQGYKVVKHTGTYDYGINAGFITQLRALNLLDNKHIPEMYLWAAQDQRLALLQGLLDTDVRAHRQRYNAWV
jgi:replicative DNA helicase